MSELEDVKPGILQLPVELLQHILASLPDPRSLANAIQVSRTFYLAFKENEQNAIATVLECCVGTGVLPEAKLARDCDPPVLTTKLTDQPPDLDDDQLSEELNAYVMKFLRGEPRQSDLTRSRCTLSDALTLGNFHTDVILPLKARLIQASSDPASCIMSAKVKESLDVRSVSHLEEERISRALYRFELFRRLFGCFAWRTDELIGLATAFFSRFSPWEIAQIGCIHDFLCQQVIPVFNDVARHDITWGQSSVVFDADVADGTIQHILSLGLREILAIARLGDAPYAAREKALNPDLETIPRENEDFLNAVLIEINHYARSTEDKSLFNTLLSTLPFHSDPDPGPETIWSLSRPQDGSSLALFQPHDWVSRRWGYVLWDHARLRDIDRRGTALLSPLWEPAASPLPRPESPAWEEKEASWRMRSSLYARGGRGWWAEGDESKVQWPRERMCSRYELSTKIEREEKPHHEPGSLEDAKRYWAAELTQQK